MEKFLQELEDQGIQLKLSGNDIEVIYHEEDIAQDLLQLIKSQKNDLIRYLRDKNINDYSKTIKKSAALTDYPLSSSQRRLWVISQFEGGIDAYHLSFSYEFDNQIDIQLLKQSFIILLQHQEVLRTIFKKNNEGEVRQHIIQIVDIDQWVKISDLREQNEVTIQSKIEDFIDESFNLETGPLISSNIFKLSESRFVFACKMHHIIIDGWSISIFFNELIRIYKTILNNPKEHLLIPELQYSDYVIWEQEQISDRKLNSANAYWMNQFSGEIPVINFPTDYSRPVTKSYNGGNVAMIFEKATFKKFKEIVKKSEATLFMGLLSLVNVLIYKYTQQEDQVIGCPVSGRNHSDFEKLIGCFINTIALRTKFNPQGDFNQLLTNVKDVCINSFTHQHYPFDYLVKELSLKRDSSRSPLFDIMIILQNTNIFEENAKFENSEFALNGHNKSAAFGRFDLTFEFKEFNNELALSLEYNSDLFSPYTATSIAKNMVQLMATLVEHSGMSIEALDILTENEKKVILSDLNGTKKDYGSDKNLIQLFERQVEKYPDDVAVSFNDQILTYKQLNEKINQLAHYLQKHNVKHGVLVPICLPRSTEMIVAILGVLKSGAAYVPIDPGYPDKRISFLIKDVNASIIICTTGQLEQYENSYTVVNIDNWSKITHEPVGNPGIEISGDHLSYVIYTSGSTGNPKGVMVKHEGVLNRLKWGQECFKIGPGDAVLQKTTFCFDVSVWELFWPLITGSKLVFSKADEHRNNAYLKRLINEQKITVIHFIPSMLDAFLYDLGVGECPTLSKIFCSGDVLKKSTAQLLNNLCPGVDVYNLYGPTEASIEVTCFKLENLDNYNNVPIGKPAPNVDIYILDKSNNLCPIGCVGELYIGGIQVASGYLNNNDLTKQKFVINPFNDNLSEKVYKSGDLARWLQDGNIEYLGRMDDQVKVRGYRIELSEIENHMIQCPGILQSTVIAKQTNDTEKQLVAFFTSEYELRIEDIKAFLKARIPEHMVPYVFIKVDELPRLQSGKIDKKELLKINTEAGKSAVYVAPRTAMDVVLTDIWKRLLQIDTISIQDNFFEIGGHSILAIRMVSELRHLLNVEVNVKEIFISPTIQEFADFLNNTSKVLKSDGVIPLFKGKHVPLSFNQERLWLTDQMYGSIEYHISASFKCYGDLKINVLEWAFKELVKRHKVLRTVIKMSNGEPSQFIRSEDNWKLNLIDIAQTNEPLDEVVNAIANAPFDLSNDYMLRATAIVFSHKEILLTVNMHHIAADGWSMEILTKELFELYNSNIDGREAILPVLPIQYADFSAWQRKSIENGLLKDQYNYWTQQLNNFDVFNFPKDNAEVAEISSKGNIETYIINEADFINNISMFCKAEGITVAMLLMSVFKILLHRYTGQNDITIGSFISNRSRLEVHGLIGFFVNTILFRSNVSGDMDVKAFLKQVKKTSLEAYNNQDLPYEKIVEGNIRSSDKYVNKLFNVIFDYQMVESIVAEQETLKDVRLTEYIIEHSTSKFDLGFMVIHNAKSIHINIEYPSAIYNVETIKNIIANYIKLLQSVLCSPNKKIADLETIGRHDNLPLKLNIDDESLFDFSSI